MRMRLEAKPSPPPPCGLVDISVQGKPGCSAKGWLAGDSWLTPPQAAALPKLSFHENLKDFDFLWKQRVEPSQRLTELVADVLHDRVEIERRYGHSLIGLSRSLQLDRQGGSVDAMVDRVMESFRKRGERALNLSQEVERQASAALEAMRARHEEAAARTFADVDSSRKARDGAQSEHASAMQEYGACCGEAEGVALDCLQGISMRSSDRLKLAEQAATLSKRARQAEVRYYASVDEGNKALAAFDEQMPKALSTLQDMDEKRARCICCSLGKLVGLEEQSLQAAQEDFVGVKQAHHAADPAADLQDFIQRHQGQISGTPRESFAYSAQPFYTCDSSSQGSRRSNKVTVKQRSVEASTHQMVAKLRPQVGRLFSEDLQPCIEAEVRSHLEQLRRGMPDAHRRAAVVQALCNEVLTLDEATHTELEGAKPAAVAPAVFDPVVALFKAGLDACEQQQDAWCGRDLMVLAQRICSGGSSLLSRVYDHALWGKVSFWESSMTVGLLEALAAEGARRRALPAGTAFDDTPTMTVFLQRFVGHMLAFGISYDQGREFVSSTLRKHESLLEPHTKAYASLMLRAYECTAMQSPRTGKLRSLEEVDHDEPEVWVMDADDAGGLDRAGPRRGASHAGRRLRGSPGSTPKGPRTARPPSLPLPVAGAAGPRAPAGCKASGKMRNKQPQMWSPRRDSPRRDSPRGWRRRVQSCPSVPPVPGMHAKVAEAGRLAEAEWSLLAAINRSKPGGGTRGGEAPSSGGDSLLSSPRFGSGFELRETRVSRPVVAPVTPREWLNDFEFTVV